MKGKAVTLYCEACARAFGCIGVLPSICPRCDSPQPNWTTTPPFKLSVMDRRFLKSMRIAVE